MPNLFDKDYYVLHYEDFKGKSEVKKVQLVLEFDQSQQLKSFVKFNTNKKIEAGKNNEKDEKGFYRLMNNIVLGKTIEKLGNRIDLRLITKNIKNTLERF